LTITCGSCGASMNLDPTSKELPTNCPTCHQRFDMVVAGMIRKIPPNKPNESMNLEKEKSIQYGASGEFVLTVNPTLESVKFTLSNLKSIKNYLRYVEAQMTKADSVKGT
jgi:hypothetical protein